MTSTYWQAENLNAFQDPDVSGWNLVPIERKESLPHFNCSLQGEMGKKKENRESQKEASILTRNALPYFTLFSE